MVPIFPRSVAPFEEAYLATFCPACGVPMFWAGGFPIRDSGSEQPVLLWATVHCGQGFTLRRVQQRPSDHTLWHGYVDYAKLPPGFYEAMTASWYVRTGFRSSGARLFAPTIGGA